MDSDLAKVLASVGKSPAQLVHPDGSRLLLLPYGARVLGLFASGSDENFFWTHPALGAAASAQSLYQTDDWHNSGGDRTWLAPEVDIFFPNFPNTDVWRVPAEVDPGNYVLQATGQAANFVSPFTVTLSRSREKVGGKIAKSYRPAANPLRYERRWDELSGVAYAGYTQETSLELSGDDGSCAQLGLWSLLALPAGGEILIPTHSKDEPKVYAGPIAQEALDVTEHLVRFRPRERGVRKIAIRAVVSTGRFGYLYPSGRDWALVVRNYTVDPSGEYVDVPWHDQTSASDVVYCTQVCSVNNELGAYCELEYHVPAAGGRTGRRSCRDVTQVWAFRGPEQSLRTVARILLSAEI